MALRFANSILSLSDSNIEYLLGKLGGITGALAHR
jgi:hypothetical protein